MAKNNRRGSEAFEKFYAEIYKERWPQLKQSLMGEGNKVRLLSPFVAKKALNLEVLGPLSFSRDLDASGYELDWASLIPVVALDPSPGQSFLDLCSAPGGKALATIYAMNGMGEFVLNEMSESRVKRLKAVMTEFLPPELRKTVVIKKHDGSRWGLYEQNRYARVLVDAPCTGEAHLLENSKELMQWSESRGHRHSIRQVALLCAALEAAQVGGRIVYSTCSLNPQENDQTIARFLKKRTGRVKNVPIDLVGEETQYGRIILPDIHSCGPIYYSILEKLN